MPPQKSAWDEAVARTQGQQPAQASGLVQTLANFGVPETLGGIGGGLLGGLPGAVLGAGGVRLLKGLRQGESPQTAAVGAAGQGMLEAIPFGIGKAMTKSGTALVRATLPKATEIFTDVGRGNPWIGRQVTAERVAQLPGMTPRASFESARQAIQGAERQIGRTVRGATRAGVTVEPGRATRLATATVSKLHENVAEPGAVSTANRIMRKVAAQPTEEVLGRATMTPVQLRRLMRTIEYQPGIQNTATPQMASALKTGMSRELKRVLPALKAPLRTETEMIPTRDVLAQMVPGTDIPGGRVGLRGIGLGVPSAMARGATFGAGKGLIKAAHTPPISPALLRAWMGLNAP